MKEKKKFAKFIGGLLAIALVAFLIAFAAYKARAQQYFTNSTSNVFGAYQYNQNFSTPLFPSRTLAAQYAAGILSGTILPGSETNATSEVIGFSTNLYTQPPVVIATSTGTTTNAFVSVGSITTTNFTLTYITTNGITFYWQAVGH